MNENAYFCLPVKVTWSIDPIYKIKGNEVLKQKILERLYQFKTIYICIPSIEPIHEIQIMLC